MHFYRLSKKFSNLPIVVQNHGEAPAQYHLKNSGIFKKPLILIHKLFQRSSFPNVDLFYVLYDEIRKYMDSVPNEKIKVSTTGVDEEKFKYIGKSKARKILGISANSIILTFIGRLNDVKGVKILIDIYNELKIDIENLVLILIGSEKNDKYYSNAEKSGAKILGFVNQDDLYLYLNASDIYVLPKLERNYYFGGVGMLPVQSLFCGTPIVGETVKSIPNDLKNQVGIFADNHKEIKKSILDIINKKVVFKDLREKAKSVYSWEIISKTTRNEYDKLINNYYQTD